VGRREGNMMSSGLFVFPAGSLMNSSLKLNSGSGSFERIVTVVEERYL
jgi:hypothetical protein